MNPRSRRFRRVARAIALAMPLCLTALQVSTPHAKAGVGSNNPRYIVEDVGFRPPNEAVPNALKLARQIAVRGTYEAPYEFFPGVNASGQVAGGTDFTPSLASAYDFLAARTNAFPPGTPPIVSGFTHPDGSNYSNAFAINDAGRVTGEVDPGDLEPADANGPSGQLHAFRSSPNSGMAMEDLGTLAEDIGASVGRDINNTGNGQVVGSSTAFGTITKSIRLVPLITRAFRYTDGQGMVDLGAFSENASSLGFGINDLGQCVGSSEVALPDQLGIRGRISRIRHAFRTDANGQNMQDLGTLGGDFSEAYEINNAGRVVGTSEIEFIFPEAEPTKFIPIQHAFLTDANGANMQDLGALDEFESSIAWSINNLNVVVGASFTPFFGFPETAPQARAFIYTQQEGMLDLNTLISVADEQEWDLLEATDINDAGQIVGFGTRNGLDRVFRLSPISPTVAGTGHVQVSGTVEGTSRVKVKIQITRRRLADRIRGEVQFTNHGTGQMFRSTEITLLEVGEEQAVIGGFGRFNNRGSLVPFAVTIQEQRNGPPWEPGRISALSVNGISWPTGYLSTGYALVTPANSGGSGVRKQ